MSTDFTATSPVNRTAHTTSGVTTALTQAVQAVTGALGAFAAQYRVWRDIRELRSLSDATLKDIGVHRSEIMSLVHQQAFEGVDGRDGQH